VTAVDNGGVERAVDPSLEGSTNGWLITVQGEGVAFYDPTTRMVTYRCGSTPSIPSVVTITADADTGAGMVTISEQVQFTPAAPPTPLAAAVSIPGFSAPRIQA
jgi:hypothetical protein